MAASAHVDKRLEGGEIVRTIYEAFKYEGNAYASVQIDMPKLEETIMDKYDEYWKYHAEPPTQLVLSEHMYQALKMWCAIKRYMILDANADIETFHGMRIVRLKRYDKHIIEVG